MMFSCPGVVDSCRVFGVRFGGLVGSDLVSKKMLKVKNIGFETGGYWVIVSEILARWGKHWG